MNLTDIINDFKGFKFPNERLRINSGAVIINQERFFNAYVTLLKAQSGNWAFKPYFDTLVIFHQIHFKNESNN